MLTIHKADPNGAIQITYSGWLLDDKAAIILLARWIRPSMELPYVTFAQGDLLFETFYRDRPYNIFALYDGSALPAEAALGEIVEQVRNRQRRYPTSPAYFPQQICSLLPLSCMLKGYYINFTYPVLYDADDGILIWRDLALDLWVPPAGQPLILDEAEYNALDLAHQDPALYDAIEQARERLWAHAVAHTGPFAPTIS